ncbi:MAG: sodium-dependent transporter [Gemmatimonadetes bacterium]|nr:sodium-dependent transporter [Gemmatimonadota bacterium]
MAGNAVGLGNFLRFPTQAANNGGGSFMITYFAALLLLGIPLMWIEWGLGRNGGRYRKGHLPGLLAAVWRHPAAKYLGVVGLVIPMAVMVYYTYIESWTLAYAFFSATGDYWGRETQDAMVGYLRSFQGVGEERVHGVLTPFLFFTVTLVVNIWVVSKGVAAGIERLARIAMPTLFILAVLLAIAVLLQPPSAGGDTPIRGLQFIYGPDFSRLTDASVWLASAGQIFFTLSVGMGSLAAYASYLSRRDDIALNGLATAATNETAEVVLGGTIAIPAAVTFFGVSGAVAIAQSGSFNLGFATMSVVFQQMAGGQLLGTAWFGLLFFAGITSSVAMLTPILAFLREEFGVRREWAAWGLGGITFVLGLLHIIWLEHGFLDEWDYWAGTFGLVVVALLEVIAFVWIYGPANAWRSIHEGADIRIPRFFKFVITYVTPVYLLIILVWWGATDALPILGLSRAAGGGPVVAATLPYIWAARAALLGMAMVFLVLIHWAWRRNGYDDRAGLPEVPELQGGDRA